MALPLSRICLLWPLLYVATPLTFPWTKRADEIPSNGMSRLEIILVGATSNLAQKYLWQSFFREHIKPDYANVNFQIYGAATRDPEEGVPLIGKIVNQSTTCTGLAIDSQQCDRDLQSYRANVQYVQLRGEGQYKSLGRGLRQAEKQRKAEELLIGRLIYLSISPDLYASVAKWVSTHLRPQTPNAWLRVVLEKPFGRDQASAQALASELTKYLREEEIYRVDHYMGKMTVQGILAFRETNQEVLENGWNSAGIDGIEVAMLETEDVEGRTSFYESYGVLRDVMQNHLTQILCLLALDLSPDKSGGIFGSHKQRTAVLSELVSSDMQPGRNIHLGQYEGYTEHVRTDRRFTGHFVNTSVPTAATVTLRQASPRWEGVKLTLQAGKALESRSSYARVTFRGKEACQLLFNIQGGELQTAAIAWPSIPCQGILGEVRPPSGWTRTEEKDLQVLRVADAHAPNAYEVVVSEVMAGERAMFLDTEELLHQWSVWDPIVKASEHIKPAIYPRRSEIDVIVNTEPVDSPAGEAAPGRGEEL